MVEKAHTSGFWPDFYGPLRGMARQVADWFAPAAEASGAEGSYRITMELPGVAEEDIHLSTQDGTVTVKGEKHTEHEEQGESWYFSERQYGSFNRSFRLPPDADAGQIEAALKDGVLTITVPKAIPKAPEQARIPIRRG